MAGRNSQVSRIYRILLILEGAPQGLTIAEIESRVRDRDYVVSERTIRRDLDALDAAGFPLQRHKDGDDRDGMRFVLESHTRVSRSLVLSNLELMALYMARGVLEPLRDTPFYQDLATVFSKIEEKIGTKAKEHFAELASEFRFEPGPRWGLGLNPDTLETVRASCSERQILEVTYESAKSGDKRKRRLGPHYLYFAKGSIYLLAEDLEEKKVKVFGVPRMTDAKMLNEPYDCEPVNPEEYFKGSFGIFQGGEPVEVKIEFEPAIAPFVRERRWHGTQRVVNRAGGGIVLSLDVAITPELVQWILGFGCSAAVTQPRELGEQIRVAAEKTAAIYKPKRAA